MVRVNDTMGTLHPYHKQFMEDLTEAIADVLSKGREVPYSTELVDAAAEQVYTSKALYVAERDGRRFLAWLLRRQLKALQNRRVTSSG